MWPWVLVGVVVLAAAVIAAHTRLARIAVVVVATAATFGVASFAYDDLVSGTPGPLMPVLAVSGLVFTIIVAFNVRKVPAGKGSLAVRIVCLIGVAVLLTGAGVLAANPIRNLPEQSTTASATSAPDVPSGAANEIWTQTITRSGYVRPRMADQIVSAGAGFVTTLGYADAPAYVVTAVDGTTGEQRWSYSLDGARPVALMPSPGGAYVVATFRPITARATRHVRVVVLDAFTGEPLTQFVGSDALNYSIAPTDDVLAVFDSDLTGDHDGPDELVGLALDSGKEVWRTSAPDGCSWVFTLPASTPTASLQAARCEDKAVLFAIDDSDGSVQWTFDRAVPQAAGENWGMTLAMSADRAGNFVGVRLEISGLTDTPVLLDAASGELAFDLPDNYHPAVNGPLPVIVGDVVVIPGEQTLLPVSGLCDGYQPVTTTTSVITVCGEDALALTSIEVKNGRSTTVDLARKPSALITAPGAIVVASYDDDLGDHSVR